MSSFNNGSRLDGLANRVVDALSLRRRLRSSQVVLGAWLLLLAHIVMVGRIGWHLDGALDMPIAWWAVGCLAVFVSPYVLSSRRDWQWRLGRYALASSGIAAMYALPTQRAASLSYSTIALLMLLTLFVAALTAQGSAASRSEPVLIDEAETEPTTEAWRPDESVVESPPQEDDEVLVAARQLSLTLSPHLSRSAANSG